MIELKQDMDALTSRSKYTTDDQVVDDILKLFNLANYYLHRSTNLDPSKTMAKPQQGFLTGHICRIMHVLDTQALLLSNNKFDLALLLSRVSIEGCIIYEYIRCFGNEELYDGIINKSLYKEKKIYNQLRQKYNDSFMSEWISSFKKRLFSCNKKQNEIKKDLSSGLPDVKRMADKINKNELYNTAYDALSGLIHGSWHSLNTYYLQDNMDYYKPILESVYTSPFPFFLICQECLNISAEHHRLYAENIDEVVQEINALRQQVARLSKLAADFKPNT